MLDMENLGATCAAIGLGGTFFKYVVISPLQNSINSLKDSIERMTDQIVRVERQQHDLELKINDLNNQMRHTWDNIRRIEGRLDGHSIKKKVE